MLLLLPSSHPSPPSCIERTLLYRILMMRHERHTMYRCGINTLRNLAEGWVVRRDGLDLFQCLLASAFPHYGAINIQYTFYKILYLDNICALCRLSCAHYDNNTNIAHPPPPCRSCIISVRACRHHHRVLLYGDPVCSD